MNNITKEKALKPIAVAATIVFSALTLLSLFCFLVLVFTESTIDNMLMFLCFFCLMPALGFYYAFSRSVHFTKKLLCVIISAIACVVMDIIYIIVALNVKDLITMSGIFGISPVVTYIVAVFAGQLAYFVLFLKLCKKEKKIFELLAIICAVFVPIASFGLSLIILIVVSIYLLFIAGKVFLKFAKIIGADQPTVHKTYTVNDGGRTYTLTYYHRNSIHHADEYRDEFNNSWITKDNGRTFFRI